MRLIDADALKERKFGGVATWHGIEADSWRQGWNDAIDTIIEAVPTIEAVPVVRCKDCKYYLHSSEICGIIDTRLHFYETDKRWSDGCFCSWGERKETEDG